MYRGRKDILDWISLPHSYKSVCPIQSDTENSNVSFLQEKVACSYKNLQRFENSWATVTPKKNVVSSIATFS